MRNPPLAALTAERLDELAAHCEIRRITIEDIDSLAVLCRAVASAEQWMRADPVDRTVSAATDVLFEAFDARFGSLGMRHTLAAALASIPTPEETTDG